VTAATAQHKRDNAVRDEERGFLDQALIEYTAGGPGNDIASQLPDAPRLRHSNPLGDASNVNRLPDKAEMSVPDVSR
jgi:hypothetical protein